jgi:DNA-binding LacI/PurR family transcriptional regulator
MFSKHPREFAHSVMIVNIQASLSATRHLIVPGHHGVAYPGDRHAGSGHDIRVPGELIVRKSTAPPTENQ